MSSVVTQDPGVLGGESVFAGTSVPVKSLFDHQEAGDSIEEFLKSFPSVERAQVLALLEEARRHVIRPLPSANRTTFPIFSSRSPGALDLSAEGLTRLEAEEDTRVHERPA